MTKVKRTIITVAVVEAMLAGLWAYLAATGAAQSHHVSADFQQTLGSTMGGAMGAFLGLSVLLIALAYKNDRAAR